MKYYVIEISTGDAKIAGKGVYEYDTESKALATLFKKMGTAMSSDLYESELLLVINQNGAVVKRESYEREQEKTEE